MKLFFFVKLTFYRLNEKLKLLEKNGNSIPAFKAACEYFKEMKKLFANNETSSK